MYKVTIQSTPVGENNWGVVTSGTWNSGEPPQLEDNEIVPAKVVAALFKVTHSAIGHSGRNQVQDGDTLYAVVFRRLSRSL